MRITAGQYRNRRLYVPEGKDVRPTTDKIRQALFNMLLHYDLPEGANVLDGFCGSGALGLEALSRGANSCIFIDKDIRPCTENVQTIAPDTDCTLLQKDVRRIGQNNKDQDSAKLVFLDPPYNKDLLNPALQALVTGEWIAKNALCILECEKTYTTPLPVDFQSLDERTYGETKIIICRYKPTPEE